MIPIPGTSSIAHLEENCEASNVVLPSEAFAELTSARRLIRRWALSD
jgi:aryl-alcohol dehydrogenase-like predicted oxidoreductase